MNMIEDAGVKVNLLENYIKFITNIKLQNEIDSNVTSFLELHHKFDNKTNYKRELEIIDYYCELFNKPDLIATKREYKNGDKVKENVFTSEDIKKN